MQLAGLYKLAGKHVKMLLLLLLLLSHVQHAAVKTGGHNLIMPSSATPVVSASMTTQLSISICTPAFEVQDGMTACILLSGHLQFDNPLLWPLVNADYLL